MVEKNNFNGPSGPGPPHYRGFTIALRQITRYDSSGRVIGPAQRTPPDNTQHSQQTDIHAPAGFEPTIPTSEWLQIHALERAVTGMGINNTGLQFFFFFLLVLRPALGSLRFKDFSLLFYPDCIGGLKLSISGQYSFLS